MTSTITFVMGIWFAFTMIGMKFDDCISDTDIRLYPIARKASAIIWLNFMGFVFVAGAMLLWKVFA